MDSIYSQETKDRRTSSDIVDNSHLQTDKKHQNIYMTQDLFGSEDTV